MAEARYKFLSDDTFILPAGWAASREASLPPIVNNQVSAPIGAQTGNHLCLALTHLKKGFTLSRTRSEKHSLFKRFSMTCPNKVLEGSPIW